MVVLPRSKVLSRTGARESIVVSDSLLVRVGNHVFRSLAPGALLLPFAYPRFLRLSGSTLDSAGVLPGSWSFHSLRRGGATHLFSSTSSFDRVTQMGRWSQVRTARLYVNEALALVSSIRALPSHLRRLAHFSARLRAFLVALPP